MDNSSPNLTLFSKGFKLCHYIMMNFSLNLVCTLNIDVRSLNRVLSFDPEQGLIEVEADAVIADAG